MTRPPEPPTDPHAAADPDAATLSDGLPPPPRRGAAAVPPPGAAGRLRLLDEIGRGGMGAVHKAHDPALGRDVAVKVLLERYQDEPEVLRRFLDEARVGGQLQHPGVVPVYDLGCFPDGRPFFAMKLVEGRTLAALLAERPTPADDLPRFLKVFEQVCQAVGYAHSRGVIHRDLKPSNVMVGAFGEVQVMDWGLAKVRATRRRPGRERCWGRRRTWPRSRRRRGRRTPDPTCSAWGRCCVKS
jgi:serine/threonine protein kinase